MENLRWTRESLLLHKEQLVRTETEALEGFFGRDIAVSEPPIELFQTQEKMTQLDITGFEPHFLPQVSLTEEDQLPGWKVRPKSWFWQKIKENKISEDAATLKEGWYLVDGRTKPNNYGIGQQRYRNDYMEAIMQNLREKDRIYRYTPEISRFGVAPDEIEKVILPELARIIDTKGEVENNTYMKFNVWGNMFHPEWGETDTWEWFADKFGEYQRLYGGDADGGGLAIVDHNWSGNRSEAIAFNLVVRFPSKPR